MAGKKKKRLTKKFLTALAIPAVFIPGLILASFLGWNWQRDLGKLVQKGGFYKNRQLFPKTAVVQTVIDGDTMELASGRVIRLVGVDTPGRGKSFYGQALEYSIKMSEGKKVKLEYDAYQDDKYGRILVYLFVPCTTQKGCVDGQLMLNKSLLEKGLGELGIYQKRKKLKYEQELIQAENEAKEEKIGIWEKI